MEHVQNPERFVKLVLDVFNQELEVAKARNIKISGNSLIFTGGLFRMVSNWNLLGPISRGKIEIETNKESLVVRFWFSFVELVIIATLVVIAMFYAATSGETRIPLSVYGVLWGWLVGANIIISTIRFRGFIERCVKKALNTTEIKELCLGHAENSVCDGKPGNPD